MKPQAQNQPQSDEIYDLYGVIVHQGSSRSFGHYYAYCRGFETDNTWYKCNDESISKINGVNAALGKQAYILLYQKRISKEEISKSITLKVPESKKAGQAVRTPASPESNDVSTASGTDKDEMKTQNTT